MRTERLDIVLLWGCGISEGLSSRFSASMPPMLQIGTVHNFECNLLKTSYELVNSDTTNAYPTGSRTIYPPGLHPESPPKPTTKHRMFESHPFVQTYLVPQSGFRAFHLLAKYAYI